MEPEANPLKMNIFNGAVIKTPVAWGFFPTQENIGRKTSQYKDPYKDHCSSFFGPGSPCCCMLHAIIWLHPLKAFFFFLRLFVSVSTQQIKACNQRAQSAPCWASKLKFCTRFST